MIIVTGMPRTGTSLVMQTMDRLGMNVHGEQFPPGMNQAHNPKGFWEGDLTLSGRRLQELVSHRSAVKVNLRKLIEYSTLSSVTDKIIVCRRNPAAAVNSIKNTIDPGVNVDRGIARHIKWYAELDVALDAGGKFDGVPFLNVPIAAFRSDPALWVGNIKTFAATPSSMDPADAVGNVDP